MPSLAELAENANTYTPLGPTDERIVTDRYVLWMGRGDEPGWNVAQRFRLQADEVVDVRAEIHGHLQTKGRAACTWEIGTHATPEDLVERLLALGLVDDEPTPLAVGMVLTEPPAQPPPDVEVRRAVTRAEHLAAARIAAIAFGGPVPTELPADPEPDPHNVVYLAYVDGEPVARASASFSEHAVALFGGSTLPEARGRGAYRALVAARWQDAVARGTPALVTQASPMSRPILEQLGFRELCAIRILLDSFGAVAP
jgi:GNAT superfamily N-acetyltransferase